MTFEPGVFIRTTATSSFISTVTCFRAVAKQKAVRRGEARKTTWWQTKDIKNHTPHTSTTQGFQIVLQLIVVIYTGPCGAALETHTASASL